MANYIAAPDQWFNASNWSEQDNNGRTVQYVPGINDNVVISSSPSSPFIAIAYNGTDTINSLQVTAPQATININGGLLGISNGGNAAGVSSAETVNLANGATLSIGAGTLMLGVGGILSGTVSGAGRLDLTGGSFALGPGVSLTVGTLELGQGGSFNSSTNLGTDVNYANTFLLDKSAYLGLNSHTLTLSGTADLEGTISGPGVLKITGTATVSPSSYHGIGVISGAVLEIAGGATLIQNDNVHLVVGTSATSATLQIDAGATYRIQTASNITGTSSSVGPTINNGLLIDQAAGVSEIDSPLTNNATVESVNGAVLRIAAPITGQGRLLVDSNSTIELQDTTGPGQTVNFNGNAATLKLDDPGSFSGSITGFAAGDVIDFAGKTITRLSDNGGLTTATFSDGSTKTVQIDGSFGGLVIASDGAGGSNIVATSEPAVAFDSTATFVNAQRATLTGTVADSTAVSEVEIFDGDTDLGAATVNGDGTWSLTNTFGAGDFANLHAELTDVAGHSSSSAAAYELLTGIMGAPYRAQEIDYTPNGSYGYTDYSKQGGPLVQAKDNGDGTHTITGFANSQSLVSIGNDLMTGGGVHETFVFTPGFGKEEITDFAVGGPGHDVIDLTNTNFTSFAQVLYHTTMGDAGAEIHLNPHDTITLDGVSKGQLVSHLKDFALA